jgi:hypothetical protein
MIFIVGVMMYASSIIVTYPNGGEIFEIGSAVTIKWTSTDVTGKMVILLYKKGIMSAVISNSCENTGSFQWNIPSNFSEGSDYRIRIRSINDLTVNDFSDGDFTISK